MSVELILLENVDNLGAVGETIRVADGYARNYLLPRRLAAPISKQVLQQIEAKKLKLQQEYEQNQAAARDLGERLEKMSVTIAMEANEQDKLYGSVSPQQIVEALAEEKIKLDRHCVALAEPLRELGVYNVDLQLTPEVRTSLKVWVVKA